MKRVTCYMKSLTLSKLNSVIRHVSFKVISKFFLDVFFEECVYYGVSSQVDDKEEKKNFLYGGSYDARFDNKTVAYVISTGEGDIEECNNKDDHNSVSPLRTWYIPQDTSRLNSVVMADLSFQSGALTRDLPSNVYQAASDKYKENAWKNLKYKNSACLENQCKILVSPV